MEISKKGTSSQMEGIGSSQYDSEFRFLSYWKQIEWCGLAKAQTILYFGIGTGFVPNYLKKQKYLVDTVDNDKKLSPTYVMGLESLSKIKKKYDLIMACEILEHVPLDTVETVLVDCKKISDTMIISIPENRSKIWFSFKIPLIKEVKFVIPLPFFSGKVTSQFHYWELNPKTQKVLEKAITETGWKVVKRERVSRLTTHYFYYLKKA